MRNQIESKQKQMNGLLKDRNEILQHIAPNTSGDSWTTLTMQDICNRDSNFWATDDACNSKYVQIWNDLNRHLEERDMLKLELSNWTANAKQFILSVSDPNASCPVADFTEWQSQLDRARWYLCQRKCKWFHESARSAGIHYSSLI
jgi:hypothetical protein